jgi:acetyl-CoA synthetase
LIKQRTNYEAAYAEFSWPKLETFNWALDYFDAIAQNNTAPALHIVEDSGHQSLLGLFNMVFEKATAFCS